ncbi:MAG: undecaprenyldiphospho-muramoylpentapeptide beta-N-acetylglucosaminyltransferase [Candidatus Eiseniibacteriota bacterium]
MSAASDTLVVLAAGGTGGHVFPADALAGALIERGCKVALVTDRRGGSYGGTLGKLDTHRITAGQITGRGPVKRLRGLIELALGTLQARRLLGRLKPAVVVGFGGYASIPTMIAASWAGIPTVIHEQNAVLGRANRLLAHRVTRIARSFEQVRALGRRDVGRAVMTGNPVRAPIAALAKRPYDAPVEGGKLSILVTGGSQGATVFSRVVPAAIARLPEAARRRLVVAQQARPADIEEARAAYAAAKFEVELKTFFDDMPARLAAAHLVICRSGASTCAEITAAGRPAILVPYPHATDDHQTANARALEATCAAWLMPEPEFTPEALAERLLALLESPAVLGICAQHARGLGRPDAAARLADVVLSVVRKETAPAPNTVMREALL